MSKPTLVSDASPDDLRMLMLLYPGINLGEHTPVESHDVKPHLMRAPRHSKAPPTPEPVRKPPTVWDTLSWLLCVLIILCLFAALV